MVGMGTTGEAVGRHLLARGDSVVAVEDRPGEAARRRAEAVGVDLVEAPAPEDLAGLVAGADLVVPSPGVAFGHPVFGLAARAGVAVRSEVELAARATGRPILAVTGTNGKTTVTTLVARMLTASGVVAAAAGNIGRPLIEAVADPAAEVLVAEVSSFQLQFTDGFRPRVATWLNFAADHLDWHPSLAHYAAAKAKVWAHQHPEDLAVANADDPVVAAAAARAPGRVATFSAGGPADFRVAEGALRTPEGTAVVALDELPRALPHDVANALAATAVALGGGATPEGCRAALVGFEGLPHRVALVGEALGVRYYDDSKATTPASVLAALAGLRTAHGDASVVLVAGGRNKGLDLGALREGAAAVREVVAIGEAAPEVEAAFAGLRPVRRASSMDAAVAEARAVARPGGAVLLSPGCASFDWYESYAARGDDFARAVGDVLREAGR